MYQVITVVNSKETNLFLMLKYATDLNVTIYSPNQDSPKSSVPEQYGSFLQVTKNIK